MRRRRFLKQLAVTPLVVGHLSSVPAAGTAMPNESSAAKTLPPWADVVAQKWANASKAIILQDMSQCQPASALSPQPRHGHWNVIPYELVSGTRGKLLWSAVQQAAPPVRLQLGVKGWYAIFVGIYCTVLGPSTLWLKLDGEMAAQPRTSAEFSPYGSFTEVFFKVAELNGGALQIEQLSAGSWASAAGVVYVKLVPLAEEEVAAFLADRDQRATRRLAATNDMGFLGGRRPTTVEEILRALEVYRNTDFGTLLLHLPGADGVCYPSQYGFMPPLGADLAYADLSYKYYAEAVGDLAKKGINPAKVLIEGAHPVGMKVHVGIRPALWTYYEPLTKFFHSPFYQAHPEWRCVDRDGTLTSRMSWAVPEVRKHLIDVLREAVGFGADGAHLVFCRGVPLVLYEPPFLEIFQKRYGEDPRKLDEESEPRIKQAWAEVVATFMREARTMLDEEHKRRKGGKRLELSAMVFGNEYDNMLYGLDVRQWVAEGVIDEIFAYRWDIGPKKGVDDIRFFTEICGPKGVPFLTSYTPVPGYSTIGQMISGYEQGMQGITFFDNGWSAQNISQWTVFSRFGHVDELRLRPREEAVPPERSVQLRFHRLGDLVMDGRFPPIGGG